MSKARYWCAILYPENMRPDWETEIGDILQVPYVYCIHDKDVDSEGADRKVHVHLLVAFSNTTTQKHALTVCSSLSAEGKNCLNTIQAVVNVRHMYNYLIHDTDTCRKKGKFLYTPKERIIGNNFDIGSFEQLSIADREEIEQEIEDIIIQQKFTNFTDLTMYIRSNYDRSYRNVLKASTYYFSALTKGNYQKYKMN